MNNIFGMGAGPYQKQTGASEKWQAVEHTLIAICIEGAMIIVILAWALLIGRAVGTMILVACVALARFGPRSNEWLFITAVFTLTGALFSYEAVFGVWPEFTVTWLYWPWAQMVLIFFLPMTLLPLAAQLSRQLGESLFPNLLNSVKAQPGQLKPGVVPGIKYKDADADAKGPSVTWST